MHPAHLANAQMAYRIGGGAWLIGYIEGDIDVIATVSRNWFALKGFFNAPQHDAPLTKLQLLEILAVMFGGKK